MAAWVARALYATRSTPEVPYETLDRFEGLELRRYPPTVLVETTAPDQGTAFARLFRYIDGANETRTEVSMTAPVATRSTGTDVAMTAPVRTRGDETGVTMAFYLPEEYDVETAPVPTDPDVELVVEPERTVAVKTFSWFATGGRVQRMHRHLLAALQGREASPAGEPTLHRYDPPWTPPFLRTSEVVVPVETGAVPGEGREAGEPRVDAGGTAGQDAPGTDEDQG